MKFELFFPVRPWIIGQGFGECRPSVCDLYKSLGLKGHNGLDIPTPTGTIIRAAHDGIVVFSGEDGPAGHTVSIRTHDEREYATGTAYYKTIYCHMLPRSIKVRTGQSVKVGDIIGLADSSGQVTGPHLHFGLKPVYKGEQDWQMANAEQQNGYYGAINPIPYFNGWYADDFASIIAELHAIGLSVAALFKQRSA